MADGLWECSVLTVLTFLGWTFGVFEIIVDRKLWDWLRGKK